MIFALKRTRGMATGLFVAALLAPLAWPVRPVSAEPQEYERPAKDAVPALEQQVPIVSHSPPVADNGCPVRTDPKAAPPQGQRAIPLFELIGDVAGPISVRMTLGEADSRTDYRQLVTALTPEMRTLATLHHLWWGLHGKHGLHTFFYLKRGDLALEVQEALKAAGLAREYTVFSEAIALFGAKSPDQETTRAAYFGYAGSRGDLNSFDQRLLAVAAKFPSAEAFANALENFATGNPALWQQLESRRSKLGVRRRTGILMDQLWREMPREVSDATVPEALARFPKPERTLLAVDAFNSEFENGGVHQFFFNSTGAYAPEVHEALLELQLTRQAALFKRAMDLFASPYPRDREARTASYKGGRDVEGFESELSDITDDLYALDGGPQVTHLGGSTQISGGPGIRDAMERYAEQHKLLPC